MILDHYNDEEKIFVKQVIDYKNRSLNGNKVILTRFLDDRKQDIIKSVLGKNSGINYEFYSPIEDSNYKRCIISPFEINQNDFKISILKINYNPRYLTLTNRNVLGNIMGLQIERDVIGDILITENKECYFVCCKEFLNFFKDNFIVVNHTPITLEEIDDLSNVENKKNFIEKKIFVKSLRLDIIISHAYNISREISKELILQKLVKINYKLIENTSQNVNICDIIITRTKGKMSITDISGPNKNNNYVVSIKIYQ